MCVKFLLTFTISTWFVWMIGGNIYSTKDTSGWRGAEVHLCHCWAILCCRICPGKHGGFTCWAAFHTVVKAYHPLLSPPIWQSQVCPKKKKRNQEFACLCMGACLCVCLLYCCWYLGRIRVGLAGGILVHLFSQKLWLQPAHWIFSSFIEYWCSLISMVRLSLQLKYTIVFLLFFLNIRIKEHSFLALYMMYNFCRFYFCYIFVSSYEPSVFYSSLLI